MKHSQTSDLKAGVKRFRPELEGVRAVAAILVAVYHIWVGSVSGGVDVFFIVSGYLITTSLLSRMEKEGRLRYFEYALGLAKRLFPNAFVVILFTVVGSFLLLPQLQWRQIASEVFSSAFYYQNWQLALNAVDYLAQHNSASPLQHFWALSIQGQFYATWPLIIFISFVLAVKWLQTPLRKTLLFVLIVIFAASLAYSIYVTETNQPWAYFDTFARAWEFALGGILALLLPYLFFHKSISTALGWLGICIIAFTGVMLPVSTVFPGYAALLPISGVMLIIISAENSSNYGVARLLGTKPFMFLGGISYALYLWHWPLLLFYYAYFKTDTVSIPAGLAILALSLLLSILTTKLLEAPIRKQSVQQSKVKLVFTLALLIVTVAGANIVWNIHMDRVEESYRQQAALAAAAALSNPKVDEDDHPGNEPFVAGEEPFYAEGATEPLPPTSFIDFAEMPTFYQEYCYVGMKSRGLKVCPYGEIEDPDYVIALVGGSRAGHWFPALELLAEPLKLRIDVYNKDACRFSTQDFNGALSDSCMEWNELALEELLENPPDLLFTTATVDHEEQIPEGYVEMWRKLDEVTTIFGLRDTPSMPKDVPVCVQSNGPVECSAPREEVLSPVPPWDNTEGIPDNVYFADLSNYVCDAETCHAAIGETLIYRDKHHLTTAFARSMAEPLREELVAALELLEEEQ